MKITHRDWASLLGTDKAPERELVPLREYKAEMNAYMSEMEAILEGMKELTAVEASAHSDLYWSTFKDLVKEYGDEAPCRIGTRTLYNGVTLSCLWYRNRFVPQAESKKRRPLSTHIRKGRGGPIQHECLQAGAGMGTETNRADRTGIRTFARKSRYFQADA